MTQELMGILYDLDAGTWTAPGASAPLQLPYKKILLAESLAGREGELVREVHGDTKTVVVCDPITKDILGQRIYASLSGDTDLLVLEEPKTTLENVEALRPQLADYGAVVAVGSGSVSDLVKYATFLNNQEYCVFPTSPMNAYSTSTASITVAGKKQSIKAHNALGIFFDMEVICNCPARLVRNALGDVVCRTTAQVDWLLQHALLDTPYSETPYILLAHDEQNLLDNAGRLLDGDINALASLVRTCMLNGMGTLFTQTTHAGSMAEHLISHFLDNFCPEHPGSLHGEQVGITTLTVLRLQNTIFGASKPPTLTEMRHTEESLEQTYPDNGATFMANIAPKVLDAAAVDKWNAHFSQHWEEFVTPLRQVMLPLPAILEPMHRAGCALDYADLGFSEQFYNSAVAGARFLRDRYSILDLADDAGLLTMGRANG